MQFKYLYTKWLSCLHGVMSLGMHCIDVNDKPRETVQNSSLPQNV